MNSFGTDWFGINIVTVVIASSLFDRYLVSNSLIIEFKK